MARATLQRRYLMRILVALPPILLVVYCTQGFLTIRGLMGESSEFHLNYANDLVQDFLALNLALETQILGKSLRTGEQAPELKLVSLEPGGEPIATYELPDRQVPIYLREDLEQTLPEFFLANKGLSSLFATLRHEPVYWFHIVGPGDREVFRTGIRPKDPKAKATYAMDRSLVGYRIEIIYNSFGARQLYSVARTKINFTAIFLLFVMAVFSALLIGRSIRQKLILARQKSFFVSTVSHEFKTPLAIMKLAAETLAAGRFKTPTDEQRFRDMLINEINRLNHLVHKILSFNKIEMGQVHYHPQKIDLRDALMPSIEVFRARAISEQVKLEVHFGEAACPIAGDPDMIRHVVDNILDNAFKYRDKSDRIIFRCQREEQHVAVSVTDFGIGIAADEIPHIHKSFYRVHDPVLQGVRGSGLGLAIARYTLELAGAHMDVVSEEGKGSTFTIRFKLRTEEAAK